MAFSDLFKSKKSTDPYYMTAPEYSEATDARKSFSDLLKSDQASGDFGALSSDWGNIWDTYKKKLDTFYNGTPFEAGAYQKVLNSAAQRGVLDSPAVAFENARLGAAQGSQLSDFASQQAIAGAEEKKKAKSDFFDRLLQLMNLKPASTLIPGEKAESNKLVSALGTLGGKALGNFILPGIGGAVGGAMGGSLASDASISETIPKSSSASDMGLSWLGN